MKKKVMWSKQIPMMTQYNIQHPTMSPPSSSSAYSLPISGNPTPIYLFNPEISLLRLHFQDHYNCHQLIKEDWINLEERFQDLPYLNTLKNIDTNIKATIASPSLIPSSSPLSSPSCIIVPKLNDSTDDNLDQFLTFRDFIVTHTDLTLPEISLAITIREDDSYQSLHATKRSLIRKLESIWGVERWELYWRWGRNIVASSDCLNILRRAGKAGLSLDDLDKWLRLARRSRVVGRGYSTNFKIYIPGDVKRAIEMWKVGGEQDIGEGGQEIVEQVENEHDNRRSRESLQVPVQETGQIEEAGCAEDIRQREEIEQSEDLGQIEDRDRSFDESEPEMARFRRNEEDLNDQRRSQSPLFNQSYSPRLDLDSDSDEFELPLSSTLHRSFLEDSDKCIKDIPKNDEPFDRIREKRTVVDGRWNDKRLFEAIKSFEIPRGLRLLDPLAISPTKANTLLLRGYLSYDLILIPVHHEASQPHWVLVAIEPHANKMWYFDSAYAHDRFTIISQSVKSWMELQVNDMDVMEKGTLGQQRSFVVKCRQQSDTISCGLYVTAFLYIILTQSKRIEHQDFMNIDVEEVEREVERNRMGISRGETLGETLRNVTLRHVFTGRSDLTDLGEPGLEMDDSSMGSVMEAGEGDEDDKGKNERCMSREGIVKSISEEDDDISASHNIVAELIITTSTPQACESSSSNKKREYLNSLIINTKLAYKDLLQSQQNEKLEYEKKIIEGEEKIQGMRNGIKRLREELKWLAEGEGERDANADTSVDESMRGAKRTKGEKYLMREEEKTRKRLEGWTSWIEKFPKSEFVNDGDVDLDIVASRGNQFVDEAERFKEKLEQEVDAMQKALVLLRERKQTVEREIKKREEELGNVEGCVELEKVRLSSEVAVLEAEIKEGRERVELMRNWVVACEE
ncbi:hypothetical protein BCIN_17g00230 [Botrytis cinerea B05.10]|uniref:Ubiquitin-like protease family profile domain-containing protein n=1 Tax=Botryotinia fuckeliana (strain B05.10) TaxID=332648 RepID=A0A384K7Z7_BOTFB|nr:hypothetical protein BCIN_17g00230 [Botrytis cinerea B05.10]ATZ58884.1 hypothetical protein BCIN_17g00230 [Botrytis cinerea B05.10]